MTLEEKIRKYYPYRTKHSTRKEDSRRDTDRRHKPNQKQIEKLISPCMVIPIFSR